MRWGRERELERLVAWRREASLRSSWRVLAPCAGYLPPFADSALLPDWVLPVLPVPLPGPSPLASVSEQRPVTCTRE